ncbi:SIR2 family protein [Opitutus terrae]|uniref:Uncharacterized protein n=1 Tax=Opitutus terrae (strain DSM 11246 / JCM 15787 / PB90-1) TaxID=452637 RepID=B1ZZJ4_OPITP|nr:SIR2 family protein [Opitutus terrae]ACB76397.1 hypothetical protein Oter_3117 [Opitutus terrae PB90-1]
MSDPQRDVYLLGAGFARAISPTMPLLQGLADRVLQVLGESRVALPPEMEPMMTDNFAHALSYLEQAKPWVTESDNLRHRALFLEVSIAIARVLDDTVADAHHALRTEPPEWLTRLIRHWHQHACPVITLNYDTLIEHAAAGIAVDDSERLSAHQLYPLVLTDAGLRSSGATPVHRIETFRLLKLHGSTNWYYSGRPSAHGEPIYFVPPLGRQASEAERHQHQLRRMAVADKYPFLVPPVYDKSPLLTHETIRALWFEAGEALRHHGRLVCLGYSLPASDLTMMHFLRTTCRSDAHVLVVNQSPDAAENLRRLFRNSRVTVESGPSGDNCIRAFVGSLAGA